MRKIVLILSGLLLCGSILAQAYSSSSKKAVKRFEEAVSLYGDYRKEEAELNLLKALDADDEFVEAHRLLSQICLESGRLMEAIMHFSRSLELDPDTHPEGYRLLAGMYMRTGDYTRVLELLETYSEYSPSGPAQSRQADQMASSALFAQKAMKNPVPFEPLNLGEEVNSQYNEYWPSLSVDESLLMFTVMMPIDSALGEVPGNLQEDFFFSGKGKDGWGPRYGAGDPLNTRDNEGAQCMTADGRTLFFTACNRREGKGRCDIYTSRWTGEGWSRPVNLGSPVNTGYSEKHPSVSADGRVLLFTSDRPGGKGSHDVWLSFRQGEGWSQPFNLGDSVNSAGMEQSPFLHPDGQSLYFSSNGHIGMGQSDLFLSRYTGDGWTRPQNLGFPINTHNDEIGLTVNASGDRAYFASDRKGRGDTDLYSFELSPEIRPVPVSYLRGRIHDADTYRGLEALVQLIDLESGEVVMETASGRGEGDYFISLPANHDYALNVFCEGYLFHSEHFPFSGMHSALDPFKINVPLEKLSVGRSVVLNNVFFKVNEYALLPVSETELLKVASFLRENPGISVEIGGHTDNTGNDAYNLELSEQRAMEVVRFLVKEGIEKKRLQANGYGSGSPIADNSSEEGKAMNRRTEFKISKVN